MRYSLAISLLLAAQSTRGFQSSFKKTLRPTARQRIFRHGISASTTFRDDLVPEDPRNATSIYFSSMVSEAVQSDDDDEEIEIAARRRRYNERRAGFYRVTLPLTEPSKSSGTDNTVQFPSVLGMTLRQFHPGHEMSNDVLNLDSLVIESVAEQDLTENVETIDISEANQKLDPDFSGVFVFSVVKHSSAWNAGVRPGDILVSTAATFGESLWPKTTLEGVRSSLTSRRMVSGSASFEFRRSDVQTDNVYELTLTKPIGLQLKETKDGYVEVVEFTPNAPTLVKMAVRRGDRVVAVDSSLGGQMWPVSTVDGVISACTSRLPGQQVTLRFERPQANMLIPPEQAVMEQQPLVLESALRQEAQQQNQQLQQESGLSDDNKRLLKRCRDILKRYRAHESIKTMNRSSKFVDKFAVPAMVADKVMEALAKANAFLDSLTLSMVMDAYMSCSKPDDAIRAFETALGLNGDGSVIRSSSLRIQEEKLNKIKPNPAALTVYAISPLLQAHALKRDLRSVKRVVAAMEGRSGDKISGLETASWPGTGVDGMVVPDIQCYNIAISAASKAGTLDGLQYAIKLFNSLSDPTVVFKGENTGRPEKNRVTFNSIISALTGAGKYDEAFSFFFNMKRLGLKPDKYTYTTLIKACVNDGDLQELLYDMREQGVKDDVVTYNAMIRSLCEGGKLSEARTLITQMESRNVAPDSMTYGLLMKGLLKASKPGACLALFESASGNARTSQLTQNVYLYTTAITAASVLGDHERALELVSRMSALGIKPNTKTLTALMGACLASGRPELATEVYKRIENPDGYAMSQGLEALCRAGDLRAAADILSTQKRGSRVLSGKELMQGYSTLIATAVRYKDLNMARTVYAELLAKSYIPSKELLKTVIDATGLSERDQILFEGAEPAVEEFRFLVSLVDGILQRNLPVDSYLYSGIIACGNQLGGSYSEVVQLLMQAKHANDGSMGEIVPLNEEGRHSGLPSHIDARWEQLIDNKELVDKLQANRELVKPLNVVVGKRDSRTVFLAEKSVKSSLKNPEMELRDQ